MAKKLFVPAILALAVAGCGIDEGSTTPRILSFAASPYAIEYGGVVTLTWEVESTHHVAVRGESFTGGGPDPVSFLVVLDNDTDPRASATVRPTADTTYTLFAYDKADRATTSAGVPVTVTGTAQGPEPVITAFQADPTVVFPGGDASLHVSVWYATSVELFGMTHPTRAGERWTWESLTTFDPAGSASFEAAYDITVRVSGLYKLVAVNAEGSTEAYAQVTVDASFPAIPHIVDFTIDPATATSGQGVTMTWDVTGATTLTMDPSVDGFDPRSPRGSVTFVPAFSATATQQTYLLTATNGDFTTAASATVRLQTAQVLSFTALPGAAAVGGSPVTLAWSTAGVSGVSLSSVPSDALLPATGAAGGTVVVHPAATTVYTVAAVGDFGSTDSASVEVFVVAPGDVVVSEIQFAPAGLRDEASGEWFEVYNATEWTIPLDGFVVSDGTASLSISGASLSIPGGGYAVLGRNADTLVNGGVWLDHEYGALALGNTTGTVRVSFDGVPVDSVAYNAGSSWTAGRSMSLDADHLDAGDNDVAANWCPAAATDAYGVAGNYGTPGVANPTCP